ncbi:MAG: hypothetical protein O6928_05320 [Gammaproteobacteria bacterium]|nr:hypothetical protein [Gammaproteobacteria bacterium]
MNTRTPLLGRREFLKQSAGLTFAFSLASFNANTQESRRGNKTKTLQHSNKINAYVNISPKGRITILNPAAEMGQGVVTIFILPARIGVWAMPR